MAIFPKVDINPDFASQASLRAQNPTALEIMHIVAEDNVYPYSIMHRAIELTAAPTLENEHLEQAVIAGVSVYEAIAGGYSEINTYESVAARALAVSAPILFADRIRTVDDFLERLYYAHDRMLSDTPVLAEAVADVADSQFGDDPVAQKFALGAAGMMRSMQIFIDKRLEAVQASEEKES